jgi:hypothetical protein
MAIASLWIGTIDGCMMVGIRVGLTLMSGWCRLRNLLIVPSVCQQSLWILMCYAHVWIIVTINARAKEL